ncbi:amidohydrolase [Prosthecomicrobium hirschii]|uniref:amidohydrolase family protein n=1 Tax=Prosthecodimorpha hirschii TaxID=665126 RepID=UPI001129FD78|nr:amidohydrolase family protein [Prosthecomicrobium hirschii]TPQ52280.1 amidohydrolase [Prosthecomicrobium hirschii]
MTRRIDAHQHYWEPRRGDYGWMPADDPVLSRSYRPADLAPQLEGAGFEATVLVQAAPTPDETEYLLGIADACPTVAKVVGWIDFERPDQRARLERFAAHPKFAGVRPMIQDIADVDWMLRADVQWAFAAVADLDLTFDALGFSRHLDNFLTVFRRNPGLRVVVDHAMKPRIRDRGTAADDFSAWAAGMAAIARETQAFCKLSGLVTEAEPGWTVEALRPTVDHLLDTFGPRRLMFGSDWPVCRLRTEYAGWVSAAEALTADLGAADRAEIFGGTAARFYRIGRR